MAYVDKRGFDEKAEVEFIKRGNHDEIMIYLADYNLRGRSLSALKERGNAEEIEAAK